jgi:hypothetical protein
MTLKYQILTHDISVQSAYEIVIWIDWAVNNTRLDEF